MIRILCLMLVSIAMPAAYAGPASSAGDNADLLKTRETVWRSWFADDIATLRELVPADTIVLSATESQWKRQSDVFREADEFHAEGGKLVSLEFPRTEVQRYGDVAIVWSVYVLEIETNGKRSQSSGRASEIFVLRNGHWTNPGWHTDNVK